MRAFAMNSFIPTTSLRSWSLRERISDSRDTQRQSHFEERVTAIRTNAACELPLPLQLWSTETPTLTPGASRPLALRRRRRSDADRRRNPPALAASNLRQKRQWEKSYRRHRFALSCLGRVNRSSSFAKVNYRTLLFRCHSSRGAMSSLIGFPAPPRKLANAQISC